MSKQFNAYNRVKAKTVNNEMLVLASILVYFNLWIPIAPRYKPLKVVRGNVGEPLSREEIKRLIEYAKVAPCLEVAIFLAVLALVTGMRKGELSQLKLMDIFLNVIRPYIRVRRETTKTNAGARRIPLNAIGVWVLKILLARARMLGSELPGHYLLPKNLHTIPNSSRNYDSDPKGISTPKYDPTQHQVSWEKEWDSLRKRLGIEHRRFHDLRHTFITQAAEAGVPLAVIQSMVGHLSAAMTAYYTHISTPAQHDAADRIAAYNKDLYGPLGVTPFEGPNERKEVVQ